MFLTRLVRMGEIKLRKLRIENFRGIKKLEVDISDSTVLIGENNTGKTSIMNAIQKCLKDLNSRRGLVFDYYDFYLADRDTEPKSPILIELTFSEDSLNDWKEETVGKLNALKILQVDDMGLSKVILSVSCEFNPTTRDLKQGWSFLNLAGDPLVNVSDYVLGTFQRLVVFFYLPALRTSDYHFDPRGPYWGPFLKDIKLTETQRSDLESKLREVNDLVVESHESFKEVSELLDSVNEFLPVPSTNSVSIDAVPGKVYDILKRAQVSVDAMTGAKVPLDRHGEGIQSLAVLMLFSAFLRVHSENVAIIALEEPETHLHPSAVRTLWKLISKLPGQRIISTHSGDLISQIDVYNLLRLSHCSNSELISHRVKDSVLNKDELRKLSYHVQRTRGELLFARAWLLVEGESEFWVYNAVARVCNIDLHKEGVRIVEYSQTDVGMLTKLANSLGIPWYCIMDDDNGRSKYEVKVRSNLEGADAMKRLELPYENLEMHLLQNGFINVYLNVIPRQKLKNMSTKPSDSGYLEVLAAALKDYKIQGAVAVAMEIESLGEKAVSTKMKEIVERVVNLAKSGM